MGTIVPFLQDAVFTPEDIESMSMALDDVCRALKIADTGSTKEVIAVRIIDLARRGERSWIKLRDRLLAEANGAREL